MLMQRGAVTFVRKVGNVGRNTERLAALASSGIAMPRMIDRGPDHYDMEYIPHSDMVTWLLHNPTERFSSWMLDCMHRLGQGSVPKDYSSTYEAKLNAPALAPHWSSLRFTAGDLIARLPAVLPSGAYHGDLTMDNCLHGADGRFYMIDPITTEYDSCLFDLAKLMQDLECGWFIRDSGVMIKGKLMAIRDAIVAVHPAAGDPHLLILMLLRVLPYAKNSRDQEFIIKEINRLWT